MQNKDKAGEEYWSSFWEQVKLPDAVDLNDSSLSGYEIRKWHKIFTKAFQSINTNNASVLELGCGNSIFLTYFSKTWNFEVSIKLR